ncbi:sensor histidine kinase [Streptomyces sp. NBRC 110028]|uniref:sensor histidine kinase n=1 Tax=Streptomyces sp. NBRC 110028 TaxID=1621260 RepID=UPI0006E1BB29|nr:sensor histidine kinase [Streptomyces sp. NBRC 110028]
MNRPTWWRGAAAHDEDTDAPAIGQIPENRRQALIKLLWIGIWMAYLGAPLSDLAEGRHTVPATVVGALGLLVFVAIYLLLVFRYTGRVMSRASVHRGLVTICVLAAVLTVTLGDAWLVLAVYVSVAFGAVLPPRTARWAIPLNTAAMVGAGLLVRGSDDLMSALVVPSLLGGFAMSAVGQMVRTTRALREARATVAQLAANEERLRLARDLHDLLGHSLSLITLKSELAGRMLPGRPEQAAQQVADIERVSRQALVDVREAVSGFRRPTLEAELAGARTALAAAGITADLHRAGAHHPDLPPDQEGALAWALREAVTNVVRHSGARRCAVTLGEVGDDLCLTVTDDGRGAAGPHGNGLTGLAERLQLADGRLETGQGAHGGFTLRALAPLSRSADLPAGPPPGP